MSGREERNGIDLDDSLADEDYISWESDERGPQPEDFITDADRRQYDRYTDMQLQRASHFLARAWKDAGGRMNEEGDPATVIAFMDAAERMRVDPDVADRWLADTTGRRGCSVLREFADVARVPSSGERKNLYGYRTSVAESGRRRAAMKDLDIASYVPKERTPAVAWLRYSCEPAYVCDMTDEDGSPTKFAEEMMIVAIRTNAELRHDLTKIYKTNGWLDMTPDGNTIPLHYTKGSNSK